MDLVLAEQLQLLHLLQYCELFQDDAIHTNKKDRDKDVNTEIRALDTLAVLLTTGERGDVTAVALDKQSGSVELVIAKNRLPRNTDTKAVEDLINHLLNAADPEGAFPSIMGYCLNDINKRLYHLHESLTRFLPTFKNALRHYSPSLSVDDELPDMADHHRVIGSNSTMSINAMITAVFQFCSDRSRYPLELRDPDASYKSYSALCLGTHILLQSRFFKQLNSDNYGQLKRRLHKVGQYYFSIGPLVLEMNKWSSNGVIRYRWVNLPDPRPFKITSRFEEVLHNKDYGLVMDPKNAVQELLRKRSTIGQDWVSSVFPSIHAEIKIIIDLYSPSSAPSSSQRAIGCSKRSCLACYLWISSFNNQLGTKWITSGTHGKPYANWALPVVASATDKEGISHIAIDVLEQVQHRLKKTLNNWVTGRQPSDELCSSEDESDDIVVLNRRTSIKKLSTIL